MRVLITGGAGFLGLHTAWGFAKKGYDVRLLDIAPIDPAEYPPGTDRRWKQQVPASGR